MARTQLGDVVRIDGRLAECLVVSPETVTFEFVGSSPCPTCGKPDRATFAESSLNWQNQVEAVQTSQAAKVEGASRREAV